MATARRGVRRLPDVITALRPPLGVACGLATATGHPSLAGVLYLVGYLSDVADGLLARRLGVSSEEGTARDGRADELFHLFVGLGLLWTATAGGQWWVLVALALILGAVRLARRWIGVHTVLGKFVGGATRVAMLAVFVVLAPPQDRWWLAAAGAVVFGTTYVYETRVTMAELRTGERALR